MSETKEMTAGDVFALIRATRAVLDTFSPGKHPNMLEVDSAIKLLAVDEEARRSLALHLSDLRTAIIHFERAPAGVGRASAGKR